ncbi:MAG: NAD(P)H-hydrate dehydratase [Ignavibacteria bacterium]|nr:NAD(P)H-hydrate dehydratase [Ignavibacteria bacterium]
MKNVFFNRDILTAEKSIIKDYNFPSINLMESAGINSADLIADYFKSNSYSEVHIYCGKGNNAGDGFVIARALTEKNIQVKVFLCYGDDSIKGDALINLNKIKNLSGKLLIITENFSKYISTGNILVIDCLFGIGFKGIPDEKLKSIINQINSFGKKNIISIDVPSGLSDINSQLTVNAAQTLSMGVYKFETLFEYGKLNSGNVKLIDIGISQEIFSEFNKKNIYQIEKNDFCKSSRNILSHKYSNGKVFIISGNINYPGAAILSAKAAFRSGSGAVISAVPENIYSEISCNIIESVKIPLTVNSNNGIQNSENNFHAVKEKILSSDCTLIGPGVGRDVETMDFVRKIITEIKSKFIIDADGLFAFSGHTDILKNSGSEIILTPHLGEFSTLSGISKSDILNNLYDVTKSFALKNKINLLLKSSTSIFTDIDIFLINNFGKENLATFGTGDVLSGILASEFSRISSPKKAVINSLLIQGLTSEYLYNINHNSMMASDMLDVIPKIIRELQN